MSVDNPIESFDTFSTTPVSQPVLHPEWELVSMGGFAFSQAHGILIEMVEVAPENEEDEWAMQP